MNDLSKLLIKLRGVESGRKAAKRAGISHNYLAILEKGFDPQTKAPINPSPETLMSLATAYDYSYEELMKAAGYLPTDKNLKVSSIEETEEVAEMNELISFIRSTNEHKHIKLLLEMSKNMRGKKEGDSG